MHVLEGRTTNLFLPVLGALLKVSLAARVVRLVRANLVARFGGAGRDAGRREYHDDTGAARSPEPPPASNSGADPTLARLYANLELPYGADREAVRAARRRLLARYHPDRFAGNPDKARLATELVQGINHAHDELLKYLDT